MLADKLVSRPLPIFWLAVTDILAENATPLFWGPLALCRVLDELNANSFVKAMRRSVMTFKQKLEK